MWRSVCAAERGVAADQGRDSGFPGSPVLKAAPAAELERSALSPLVQHLRRVEVVEQQVVVPSTLALAAPARTASGCDVHVAAALLVQSLHQPNRSCRSSQQLLARRT